MKGGSLCLATSLKIGLQLIERLKDLHELGYIHRDLKPENICIGVENQASLIYLIDFGLAKPYLDQKRVHIPIREKSVGCCCSDHRDSWGPSVTQASTRI